MRKNSFIILLFVFVSQTFRANDSIYNIANQYILNAKNDSALVILNACISSFQEVNDTKALTETHLLRSRVLGNLSLFQQAMEDAVNALEFSEKNKDERLRSLSYAAIAKLNYLMYNDSIAEEYLNKARKIAQKNKFSKELLQIESELAQLYCVMERNQACADLAEKVLQDAKEQDDTIYIIQNLNLFASHYINLNRWADPINASYQQKAKQYLDEALSLIEKDDIPLYRNSVYSNLIRYYRVEKNYEQALHYANTVIASSEATNYALLLQMYDHLVAIYSHLNNSKMVIHSHQQFYNLMRNQSDFNLHQSLQELNIKYETAEKELQLNKQKTRQTYLISMISAAFLILLFLSYLMYLKSKRNKELAGMNASKDLFFSIISHDLKNPVIAQRNALAALIAHEGEMDKDSLQTYYFELLKSTENQVVLLYQLLTWAQIQMGRMDFQPEVFNLAQLIDDEVKLMDAFLQQKEIELIKDYPNLANIKADRKMIATVIRNLLSNAVKFSHSKGKVKIHLNITDKGITFSIKDQGLGMDEQTIIHLLHQDHIKSNSGTQGETGSGIGISICKQLLSKHKSQLQITSSPEAGTEIRFYLAV